MELRLSVALKQMWRTQGGAVLVLSPDARMAQTSQDLWSALSLFLSAAPPPVPSYSRSIRNVSSVAGSARTMSGSLSICNPSKVKGSILSSSRGNWESESKLTSPTPAKELVRSFDRLGGDSPVTVRGDREESQRCGQPHVISHIVYMRSGKNDSLGLSVSLQPYNLISYQPGPGSLL